MMRTQTNHSTGSRPQRAELRCLLAVLPVILAALLCLSAATLAWFQFTRTNPGNSVQAGSFGLTVQITDAAGQQLQPTEGGFALDKGASYTVSLAASGTAGFCTVSGPGQFLRATQAIPADGLIMFTLIPDESGTYAFAPSWGRPENYGYDGQTLIKNKDTVGTPAAPAPEPAPGTASAVRPAEGWADTTLTAPGQENALPETSVTVPDGAIDETAERLVLTVASAGMPEGIAVQEGETAETWQISLSGLKENNAEAITVRLQLSAGLENVRAYCAADLIGGVVYNHATGLLTFTTASFGPVTVVSGEPADPGEEGTPGEDAPPADGNAPEDGTVPDETPEAETPPEEGGADPGEGGTIPEEGGTAPEEGADPEAGKAPETEALPGDSAGITEGSAPVGGETTPAAQPGEPAEETEETNGQPPLA